MKLHSDRGAIPLGRYIYIYIEYIPVPSKGRQMDSKNCVL